VRFSFGGWITLLSRILLIYEPLTLALSLSTLLPTIAVRGGLVLAAVMVRLLVAGLSVAAGLALRDRRPHGAVLARAALVASAAVGLIILNTRILPSNRVPSDDLFYSALLVAHHGAWLVYLSRSRRVRELFGGSDAVATARRPS
jgi:hypothetical protein